MRINLVHRNDKKGRYQSHEVYLKEDDFYNAEYELFSTNPFDVMGYGATKEEALKDYIRKMTYILHEWEAFEKILFCTDILTDNIKEVDAFGNYIEEE